MALSRCASRSYGRALAELLSSESSDVRVAARSATKKEREWVPTAASQGVLFSLQVSYIRFTWGVRDARILVSKLRDSAAAHDTTSGRKP